MATIDVRATHEKITNIRFSDGQDVCIDRGSSYPIAVQEGVDGDDGIVSMTILQAANCIKALKQAISILEDED